MLALTKLNRYICKINFANNNFDQTHINRFNLNTIIIGIHVNFSIRFNYCWINIAGYCSYSYRKHLLSNGKYGIDMEYYVNSKFVVKIEDIYEANGTLNDREITFRIRSSNVKLPIR